MLSNVEVFFKSFWKRTFVTLTISPPAFSIPHSNLPDASIGFMHAGLGILTTVL